MVTLKYFKIIIFSGILLSAVACSKPVPTNDTSATVYVKNTENGFQLIRNQEVFQIKGAAGNSHLAELKAAGGNTIRVYDTINLKQILDNAHEEGLAAIVDIPLPKYGDGSHFYENDLGPAKKKISKLVMKFRDHPALLYWNLGNEIYYPTFHKNITFFKSYNELVKLVRETDPNHPVSTAVIGGNRRRLASILLRSPDLDLISINSFGSLTSLEERMKPFLYVWNGPYVITEWGVNGPWEEEATSWGAPIQNTSSKTAEILEDRYNSEVMKHKNCLGSIVFFWGNKQERTNTWFSIFSEEGYKSESFHKLNELWTGNSGNYDGPEINYAYLNGNGGPSNIILPAGGLAKAEVFLQKGQDRSLRYNWEIRPEAWYKIEEQQPVLKGLIPENNKDKISFKAPLKEGPYRLFVYAIDKENNFSTTNIPFYVLNPANEE